MTEETGLSHRRFEDEQARLDPVELDRRRRAEAVRAAVATPRNPDEARVALGALALGGMLLGAAVMGKLLGGSD